MFGMLTSQLSESFLQAEHLEWPNEETEAEWQQAWPEDWQGAFRSLRDSAAAGKPTLYDALGVDREMPQEDLKRAYRALAKEHHPDRRRDSGAAMTRINEAYAVLQDPAARKHYDRILEANV